ncbi:uncharacterized protein K452DRAFT_222013 [Aplosporella prunicola CBS 121167]|uniref:Zn(2)-C6 fungal-type domain-containing protein n=1 Tax=Aplosporella prunicola CBS 121167 TaxID=1176127 RepID=A0A6A6BMB2_9PEZI|nr:uncharacterized protein K452DRAFT_222013 [Aplosporella prunicola CBS 121167]KAF2145186.1 hypothetical protein K452DRAFT_222013 [Aplosporella prunicola CBS 121167]
MPTYQQQRPLFRPIQVGPTPPQVSPQFSDNVPSPTSTIPKLGSKRGRITAIACVPCKKRKSKCNGLQPVCNTCAMKGSTCNYDMRQEHRWQGTLRVNVKKLEQELEEVKSVLPLLATTSQKEAATRLALEIQTNGFSEHSAEEIKNILQGPRTSQPSEEADTAVGSLGGRSRRSAANQEPLPAYYMEYDQNVGPSMQQALAQPTEVCRLIFVRMDSGAAKQHESSDSGHDASVIACVHMNHPMPQTSSTVSPITYVVTTFREAKRQLRADGCPMPKVFGLPQVDYNAILAGETDFALEQPLSVWVARITNVFFSKVGLPEKLALAGMLRDVMKWQICPSKQNFEKLPEWVRPTQNQTVIPHDPTIDFLPWPAVRDYFLHNQEQHVAGVLGNSLSVNWAYEESRMFFYDSNSGILMLSPAFEEHIRNIDNWSLAPSIFEQMPYLMGKVRMTGIH